MKEQILDELKRLIENNEILIDSYHEIPKEDEWYNFIEGFIAGLKCAKNIVEDMARRPSQ